MLQYRMIITAALAAAWLPAAVLPGSAQNTVLDAVAAPAAMSADTPIEVDAEQLDYDKLNGKITASGKVVVVYGGDELRADRVLVHIQSGEVNAIGNVVLQRGSQVVKAERMQYNFRTRVSSLDAPVVDAEPFRILARKVSRSSENEFLLEKAIVSTCIYKHPYSHYHVRARKITVVPGESMRARGAVWYFGRVPCFYVPYWNQRLNEQSGFRFYPGYRSRWGAYLLSSYRQRLTPQLQAEHHVDYRTERGFAVGEDLRWKLKDGFGDLSLYLLDDAEPMQKDGPLDVADIDSERYRIRLRHSQRFGARTQMLLQANTLSDPLILRDFFDREYRQSRQPENYISMAHRRDAFTITALVNTRLNDFYGNVNRLPEVRMDVFRRQLADSSLYYESQSAVSLLERVWPDGATEADYSVFRLDTGHRIYQPRRFAGWLNAIPRAGYRGTYYSASLEQRMSVDTNGNPLTDWVDSGAVLRNVFEVGGELSFKAFKILSGAGEPPWRHVAEPYVDYTLRLKPDVLPEELYQFDRTDQVGEKHQLVPGMRNKIQTKRDGVAVDVANVNLYTPLILNTEGDAKVLDLLYMDTEFRPTAWMRLEVDGVYSLESSLLQRLNTRFSLFRETLWSAGLEHRYRNGESSLLAAEATFKPNKQWAFNAFGRYEFEGSRLEEQGGYVQRTLDCMNIRLGGSVLPGYTRSDDTVRDDEYRVMLEVWLTAFPEIGFDASYR